MRLANSVNASYPYKIRGTLAQTDTGLLWKPPGYTQRTGKGATVSDYTHRCGIKIGAFEIHNRSGGNANVGIGFRLANPFWGAGIMPTGGATFVKTDAYQSRVATAFGEDGATAVNSGVVVYSSVPFSWLSANVTTAEVDVGGGAVPDHKVYYWNSTGWAEITTTDAFADSFTKVNTVWVAEEKLFVWQPFVDWLPYDGVVVGIPKGSYCLRFTTADGAATDTAAIITGMEIGTGLYLDTLADNAIWENESTLYKQAEADALVAFFSVASPLSRVYAEVETA
jgi:hypothetical protein